MSFPVMCYLPITLLPKPKNWFVLLNYHFCFHEEVAVKDSYLSSLPRYSAQVVG